MALVQFAAYSRRSIPHRTAHNQFVLYSGFQDSPPDNTAGTSAKSPAVRREGYLGMFRRLFNTRPWVATGRLLCSGGGGARFLKPTPSTDGTTDYEENGRITSQ